MGSHIDILLQGIWASLTGGWFYDPHQNIFSNTFHLYLWMALLVLPFILHLTLTPTLAIWTIYCAAIGALFALIKYVNCKLHHMFDTSEVIEEPTEKGDKSSGEKGSKIIELVSNENEVEQIEMVSMSNQSTQANAEEEGEGKEENRRQSVHSRGLQRQGCLVIKERRTTQRPDISGPAPLAECEIDEIDQSQGSADKKEDIKEGSVSSLKGAEGGIDETSDKQTSKSNQITTTAEVAINHRESDGEVEPGEVKDLVKLKEETDSDLSPEGGAKIKKRRKAVRRTKSALETTHELNPRKINPGLEDLHSSLPTRLFMREENSEENEGDNVRGGVFRPTRKRSRREKKDNTVLEDMTIVDLEGLNDGRTSPFKQRAPTPHCRKKQLVTESEKKPGRYGRSVSVDERMMPFRPRLLTPDSHSMKKIKKSDLETKPHDVKQCTESPRDQSGNVDLLANIPHSADVTPRSIGSQSETSHVNPREVSVEVRKHDGVKSKPRPSSAGDIKSLFTPFDPKSATANKNGEIHMRERYLSESSSSASNEGDSTFDTNPDNSPEVVKEEKEEGEVSKPVDENLEKMKKQGAIPKHYIRNPQPKEPSPIQEDTEAGTPSSGEMIDEDFKKKILEILDESSGNSEQMKRLVRAVIEKGKAGDDPGDGTVKEEEGEVRSSKSTTPTENSALLPSQTVQDATGVRHRKLGRSRRRGQRKSKSRSQKEKDKHIAKSHDDTSQGAVHWFQDEKGQWFSYTFGDESGTATSTDVPTQETSGSFSYTSSPSSSESGSTVIYDDSIVNKPTDDDSRPQFFPSRMNIPGFVSPQDFQELLERGRQRLTTCDSSSDSDNFHSIKEEKPKQFYKFQILPKKFLKIRFDRLALLALLDRNLGILENLIAVIIAIIVGALGALVLSSNFYHDIFVFLFCFIIASCQYSLIKSVQPDAASPMHGYNRMVVFSRPFYFCLCCGLMLLLDYCQSQVPSSSLVYGTSTTVVASLQFGRDLLKVFILCFPILFTIGLLPQVNTFLMYLLEQIDMHIFGGNASVSLTSAVYCFVRSLIAVAILYGFCYVAVEVGDSTKACEDKNLAQNAVFSIFSGILVAISYHLSRSASDPTTLWMLIKDCTCPSITESTGEGELVDPLPGKLKKCVIERLQSDLLVGIAVGIIVFSVHISTVFSSPVLQPVLSDILYYMAASVGFLIHYVIPMLRKEMPWLCCSHPVLANRERNFFEVTVTPKIMWFEKMYVWFCFFERNMMYPVVFLCALTRSTPHIICNLGKYVGPLVLVICAMKLLRFSFSNAAKQFLVISFTVFYFKYDYRKAPDTFLVYFFIVSILMSKFCDLMLKMKFIITYIAPWQITWGSAFHAFAQPFSVPRILCTISLKMHFDHQSDHCIW
ncbi:hypothetical protein FSP39_018732 [Pinctada imbricata]|uniref:Pecanex-like protein n=1 Tax=Pinctada imbricata TaxID=66713 RepID=A0AA89BZN5_PINIB|nr:hypothetical protein FSP39_018732 [Pinctada imbricata]